MAELLTEGNQKTEVLTQHVCLSCFLDSKFGNFALILLNEDKSNSDFLNVS